MPVKFPRDWKVASLSEVALVQTGLALGKNGLADPVELPYLRVANVQDGFLDLSEIKVVRVERSNANRYMLKSGDVLVTEGGDFDKLGRGFVWGGEIENCLHQNHIFAIRPTPGILDSHYLSTVLGSRIGRAYFLSCAKKSTNLASINSTELKRFPVPLPPIVEQQGISERVRVWEQTEDAAARLLVLHRSLKRGLMQELLTGRRRHPKYSGIARAEYHLGELFSERNETGRTDLPLLSITADRGVIPRTDIERKDSSSEDKRLYKRIAPGDVGYNTMRMWQGVSGLSSLEGIVSPAYTVCVPSSLVDARFAAHLFKFPPVVHLFARYSQGLVDDTLSLKFIHFAEIRVAVPPLPEQRWIADVLDSIDSKIAHIERFRALIGKQKREIANGLICGTARVTASSAFNSTKHAVAQMGRNSRNRGD